MNYFKEELNEMNKKKKMYLDAFIRKLAQGEFNLMLAVKAYPNLCETEAPEIGLLFAELIFAKIKTLTPRELMQHFPVKKEFDGNRYGCKDYFYTMQAVNEYGLDRRIEDAFDFLWDYQNDDLQEFLVCYMIVVGKKYQAKTGSNMCLNGMEQANIPYEAYADNFHTIISYDGQGTKVVMPNLAMWKQ